MFGYQLLACLLLCCLPAASGSHFRGAIFTWKPTGSGTEILISYRISWRRSWSSGTMCSTTSVGLLLPGEGSMRCFSGCYMSSKALNFICTDFSTVDDWTSGMNSFSYNAGTSGVITFGFSGNAWIGGMNEGGGSWKLVATADLSVRADTGKINSSPTTQISPIVELQYGCSHELALAVDDADKDKIKCRFASGTNECGGICKSFPGSTLDEENCILRYYANDRVGYYPVALQIEDFATANPTTPLSSIPVQFLVYVYPSSSACSARPEFVLTTPANRDRFCLQIGTEFNLNITARASNSLSEIKTISPIGLRRKLQTTWHNQTTYFMSIIVTWTPNASDAGEHTFCFSAKDSGGLSGEQRCVFLFINQKGGEPVVDSVKKSNQSDSTSGIIMDIVYDKEISQPTDESFIYIYHANGTLLKKIDASSSDVTVTDRQLSVSVGITDEELEYYVLFDKGVVAGADECSTPSPEITNETEIVVKACPPAPSSDINGFSNSSQDSSSLGGLAYYWCNTGYKLNGPHILECLLTGEWSGEAPKCEQIDCGPPPLSVLNGVRFWDSHTIYGSTASYTCIKGYMPITNTSLSCDASETWNGTPPVCRITDCGPPPQANTNSALYVESTTYGSTANYTCDQGFVMVGSAMLYCNASGKWNGSSPQCSQIVSCKSNRPIDIVVIADTSYTTDTNTVGPLPLFIKDMISHVNTSSVRVGLVTFDSCIHLHSYLDVFVGKSDFLQAKVKEIRYKVKDRMTHKALAFSREHILTECNGMRQSATKIAVILTNGESTDPELTLMEANQLRDDGVTVFAINTEANGGNEFKQLASSPEYAFSNEYDGNIEVSNNLFERLCSVCANPVPLNGLSDVSTYSINSTVKITCQEGYQLQGDSMLFCDENGEWSGSATCEMIPEECEDDCNGQVDGDYQSCTTCNGFVACSGGYLYNMPCPANLKWDDKLKRCEYVSTTCSLGK